MKPSENCYNIIKKFEGLRLDAYLDQVGVPTIGYGNTFYKNGSKVQMGDRVTMKQADDLLRFMVNMFAEKVDELITSDVTQNMFDSLVSMAYNIGIGAFSRSTLLKKVNANPNDPTIREDFNKWVKAKGNVLKALVVRRRQEGDLYFA